MKIQFHRIDTNVVIGLLVREFCCSGTDVSAKVLAMYAGTRTPSMEPQWLAAGLSQELRIKGLLCEVFAEILSRHETGMTCTKPSQENTTDLVRLEKMLDFLHTHFDQIISLQELANQVHLSREASCRIFKKMTGKTITQYLCEYRVTQSLSFVQSRQYSITQIAEMTGFSNASRFAKAFQAYIGCNPSEYNLKCQQEL